MLIVGKKLNDKLNYIARLKTDRNKAQDELAEIRKELGLTQQVLADKLHVSFQAVSKWENGGSLS